MVTAQDYGSFISHYNLSVFPIHIAAYVVAVVVATWVFVRPGAWGDVAAKGGLAVLWAWLGVVYMLRHYTRFTSAGFTWGTLFLIQAGFFGLEAFFPRYVALDCKLFQLNAGGIYFRPFVHRPLAYAGAALVIWALIFYPVTGLALKHKWPALAVFGAAAPVGIYTCGILLWTFNDKPRWRFCFVPFLWALVAGFAAVKEWAYKEDWALVAAAFVLMAGWVWAANRYKPKRK